MGTKNNPGKYDCYANLDPDEPYFLLAAHDMQAHHLVRAWATGRLVDIKQGRKPESDMAQVDEAFGCAKAMEKWLHDHTKPVVHAPTAAPAATPPADAKPVLPGSGT